MANEDLLSTHSAGRFRGLVQGLGPLATCPGCSSTEFLVEEQDGGVVLFMCLGCEVRWRYDLGYVWAVAT